MANQELTDLQILTSLANSDLFFVRDVSTSIDKQISASDMSTFFGGGTFLSHSDTPVNYTGAQNNFVKVNGAGTALEFIADPGYLLDITSESLADLSDVTITAVLSGELLAFTGAGWENQTLAELGVAPAVHTHVEADITDLQNYSLVGHTHLEADITDLQAYLLPTDSINALADVDTTTVAPSVGEHLEWNGLNWVPGAAGGGTFLSLSDTPGSFAAAGTFFVRVNVGATALEFVADPGYTVTGHTHVEADITDLQNYSLVGHTHVEADITDLQAYVLPTDSIDILADVDTTTAIPTSGDCLAWNGSNWIPSSSMAPGAHASTHVSLGSDEIDGDVLDIDFVPTNYTRSIAPTEVTTVVELTAHLAGIDTRLGGTFTPSAHTHVEADITDLQAYLLNINAESINELSDVDTSTVAPIAGDILQWNSTNWVPVAADTPGPHTHVEADITDLQAYLLNITGEAFTDLSDTPASYAAAGTFFVRVNAAATALEFVADPGYTVAGHTHVEADITDLQAYLLNINAESIDDLSDVVITTVAAGEILKFDGVNWINNTLTEAGVAPASHTHVEADITDLQAYALAVVTLTAGEGLAGGGDLTTSRTFDLDISSLTIDGAPDGSADFVAIYDDSAGGHKKVLLNNLPGGVGGGGTGSQSTVQARRSTAFLDDADTWQTMTFDLTDVENNSSEIEHDNTITSRINILKDGPVLIFFATVVNGTTGSMTEARVLKNGTTEIPGSFQKVAIHTNNSASDLDNVFVYVGAAGDYIELQFQDTGTGGTAQVDLDANAFFGAVRLTGVTNELFTDLVDTPSDYTGAGGQVVKVNAGATALEFDSLVLADLPAIAFDDLSDVVITSVALGEIAKFDGANWINNTLAEAGVAAAAHTHVEADITDLGNYSVVGHTHVEADITDLQAYLLNITNENIGDLSDVTLTTPADGELLRFNGTIWINNTLAEAGVASAAHTHVEADITDLQNYSLVGHTHLEADITDLQAYLLNITGEQFTDLSDTPANYTGAGSRFVKVNAGATALEFVADPGFLLDITGENIGDLSDVTLTTPADGEILRFNGTIWINNTLTEAGVAPASHTHVEADITDLQNYSLVGHTHVEADITDLQAYLLNITGEQFTDLSDTPANYTGAGSQFVKVNAGATALEFVADPGFLTDITNEPLSDLSDVTITTIAAGEILKWTGTAWVNNTLAEAGVAAASHTHVEADITDLQAYLLNINAESIDELSDVDTTTVAPSVGEHLEWNGTNWVPGSAGGGTFLSLSDTPGAFAGSGSEFVKVNAGATGLEFVADPGFLLDITGEPINDLADVVVTTPADGELLRFNGTIWINNTLAEAGVASAAHTHVEADITDLQAYLLPSDSIDALADVDTTTSAPSVGEHLEWDGSNWVPGSSGMSTFLALSDTPANYTAAGSRFVKVNSGATALEFVADPGFLTDITAESFDDLSDVVITTVASGEIVKFDGANWINNTLAEAGVAAAAHTHVEADITDLQAYLLNITAEPLSDLSDVTITTIAAGEILKWTGTAWINNTLAEAGVAAASHTHVEADITDLQAYLLPTDSIDVLSDVDTTTVAPSSGDHLEWNGSNWTPVQPSTGATFLAQSDTPGAYTGAGLQFVKVNAGETALEFVADPGFLTSITAHAATHIFGGSDVIDGDILEITFVPSSYTRDTSPTEVTNVLELTAHLAGIDVAIAAAGALPKWDRQMGSATNLIQTTSLTFTDVPGMTVTTKDLGAGQDGSYLIHFSASVGHASQKSGLEFQLLVDGVVVTSSITTINFNDSSLFLDTQFSWYEDPIVNGKIIKVQWRQTQTVGSVAGMTASMTDRRLIISGVPSNAVVV